MGDTVLTTPALALLKRARPDLKISVVLERPWERLLESNSDVWSVIVFERNRRGRTLAALRRLEPQLCLNLHGGPTSAWLTALSGARWRAGFGHFGLRAAYNVKIPRAQEMLGRPTDAPVHTADHLASAMFYLGVEPTEIPPARLFAKPWRREGPYAVLHVAAADPGKQWPAERFAELAHWLRRTQGLEPILLAGPGQGELLAGMKEFVTFDDQSLGEMMELVQGCELFVGNDSGPAHVAAAFGIPCVVIFGSSSSAVWRPWRTRCQVVESPQGISSVQTGAVEQAAEAVLAGRPALRHD